MPETSSSVRFQFSVEKGEGIDGQVFDAQIVAVGGNAAEGLGAGLMARISLEAPLLGPAAVAIHDDGDVLGYGQFFRKCHKQASFLLK